ncbi:RNA polymerase subunit sigma-70 [Ahniella affigens]|uniref:RNA polymerase subunit sigma-70 n=1 Tax=Ahniella affigens TaxID=2021234 RepID=A0A2P1PLT5_9GAMM|nr:ECF-type sigma factor [Ahniella affigens]AVP95805.1 RNA polymerase subunit sigma-70 [Ahniella affigens]
MSASIGPSQLTQQLEAWRQGQDGARDRLFEVAYAELRRIALERLSAISGPPCLSPTELVNEAVLRVLGQEPSWQDRAHFCASMSLYMRAVLIDHVRARDAEKRGGAIMHVTLSHADSGEESMMADLLTLDRALQELEGHDPRAAAVLHLAYFGGLDRNAIAAVLAVNVQVVDRELRFAKSWLNSRLETNL